MSTTSAFTPLQGSWDPPPDSAIPDEADTVTVLRRDSCLPAHGPRPARLAFRISRPRRAETIRHRPDGEAPATFTFTA